MSVAVALNIPDSHYNAQSGRFVSEDPIGFAGGDTNLYRYVNNSSATFIDPFGLEAYSSSDGANFSVPFYNIQSSSEHTYADIRERENAQKIYSLSNKARLERKEINKRLLVEVLPVAIGTTLFLYLGPVPTTLNQLLINLIGDIPPERTSDKENIKVLNKLRCE